MSTTDGYHPAQGELVLPGLGTVGVARIVLVSQCFLPPLFSVGYAGATGVLTLPAATAAGLEDSFNTTASSELSLPSLRGAGYSLACDLEQPITNRATSAAVVNLLQQGNITLADAAASLCAYDDTDDERAMAVAQYVSNLLSYIQDGSGIGDRWACALATWLRRYGDCEDGAILIHALLLAAGVNPGRIRTAFGTVLTSALTENGHAWVLYRRQSDEEWIPLDWTIQPSPYAVAASQIARQVDQTATYTAIQYILTDQAFFAVNDASYIARLAANRSTGAASLPVPAISGATSSHASAAVSLFAGVLATTVSVAGQTGARADIAAPAPAVAGLATQRLSGQGDCLVPQPQAMAGAGAVGAAMLPRTTVRGLCGNYAWADLALPLPALSATGTEAALAAADVALPRPAVQGGAFAGGVGDGKVGLRAVRATGLAGQGPIGQAALTLPQAVLTGLARPLSVGVGDCELPLPLALAKAGLAASWTGQLSYKPARWT